MSTNKKDQVENIFGKRVRLVRKERGLTLEDVSKNIGISKDYISKIEKGERSPSKVVKKALEDWVENYPSSDQPANQVNLVDQPGEGAISISDLVKMTIEILESNTVYRPALAANIRAFHQAMAMEEEMQEVKTELQQMRKEHMAELDELKEMIRSLGGVIPEKKGQAA